MPEPVVPAEEEPPEHVVTYQRLSALLRDADPGDDRARLREVLADPDAAAAEAAVGQHVDRVAREAVSPAAFERWVLAHEDLLPEGSHLRLRAGRWLALGRLLDRTGPGFGRADVEALEDWTQRRLAEGATAPDQLTALAEHGRTRRVRASAQQRLLLLELEAAGTATDVAVLLALVRGGRTRHVRRVAQRRLRDLGVVEAPGCEQGGAQAAREGL